MHQSTDCKIRNLLCGESWKKGFGYMQQQNLQTRQPSNNIKIM